MIYLDFLALYPAWIFSEEKCLIEILYKQSLFPILPSKGNVFLQGKTEFAICL